MDRPALIAHRGGAAEAPENTLAAFRHSLALGITMFELDVQMTRDGALVVIHDETVDRTTGAKGRVADLTWEQMAVLDAGSWFSPKYAGERVPSLREVLELLAEAGAGALVELKLPHLHPGIESRVASLLGEMWIAGVNNIRCSSFNSDALCQLRALDPMLPLGQLYRSDTPDFTRPGDTLDATMPHYSLALEHPEQVEEAHRNGKQVIVWTVNGESEMRQLADVGVDGIMSDSPTALLRALG